MIDDSAELESLLQRVRRADMELPRELRDQIVARGSSAVPALIDLATDETLRDEAGVPESWSPIHAIRLLGELEAAEAVDVLIPFLRLDDDWLNEYLPQALGRIGGPAVEPLRAALFDPDLHTWGLITAANGLRHAAEHHQELRDAVVQILTERLDVRDDPRDDVADLNGTIVSDLCKLEATESLRSILRAYHDDLVDEWMIRPEHAAQALGAPIGISVHEAGEGVLTGRPLPPEQPLRNPFAPPVESALSSILNRKVGRNDPCTCGSGRKYKKCCGR